MIATSFTLRSPCSWKLQCEMYVLQIEPLQRCACTTKVDVALPLHRRIYVYTPSPLYIYIFTRSHPQIYLSTSPHPHICTSISHLYIHTVAPSHLSCLSFFRSFLRSFFLHIFSLVCVHLHLRTLTSTDLPLHLHTSIHTVTPSHPPSLSLFLYILSTVLDNYMSRSRANRRLVSEEVSRVRNARLQT